MRDPMDTSSLPLDFYQSRFGLAPGAGDKAEIERWMQMCKELLEERERLRAELSKLEASRERLVEQRAELESLVLALTPIPHAIPPKEEAMALFETAPSLQEVIERLARGEEP